MIYTICMINIISSYSDCSETQELKKILDNLKETIFTQKMVDIFELTFAYDINNGKFFNRTLFTDFAWLSQENSKEELFSITNWLLHIKKIYIQQARDNILQFSKIEWKSDILLWTLDYIEKIIDLTILGLPFEIEKIGHAIWLSTKETEQRVQQMESIEKELFGGNIRDNPLEVVNCYRNLKTKIEKKLPTMDENQKKLCFKTLDMVKSLPTFVDIDGIFKNRKKDTRTINYKKIFEDNKTLF